MTRKKRLAQARKDAATLVQAKNEATNAHNRADMLQHRLNVAEARARQSVKLPPQVFEDVIKRAVHETISAMHRPLMRHFAHIDDLTRETENEVFHRMLIRHNEMAEAEVFEDIESGDAHITVRIPSYRWTHIIDRHLLESLKRDSNEPRFAPDRDIHVAAPMRNMWDVNNGIDPNEIVDVVTV